MAHAINWFEIPAVDFDRAVGFYSTIMGYEVAKGDISGTPYGFFPGAQDGSEVTGAVVQRDVHMPGTDGPRIFLDTRNQLADVLSRVEAAGGQIIMPLTPIPPQGTIATIIDTEGNTIGLHQWA